MAFKLFFCVAFVAVLKGGVVEASGVIAKLSDATIDPNPSYSFAYDVQDALTGDSKSQVESRANGIVKGQYTVADPDGTRRIVDYYADPVNGFNAVVRKTPLGVAVAPVVAKAVAAPVAAPLVTKAVAAPLLARAAPAPLAYAPGYAAPLAAAPAPLAVAPGLARFAAPAPAPLAVAPGYAPLAAPYAAAPYASPYAAAPLAAPYRTAALAAPYAAVPAPLPVGPGLARVAAPFVAGLAAYPYARIASPYAAW